jgi:hypothetical protein
MLEHPLSIYLKLQTPWQNKWLREFVDTIRKLQFDNKNFSLLKDKLKDLERFSEGLLFLYLYRCFTETDCSIDFIKEDDKQRSVDLKINDPRNGIDFFIECSEIKENEQEKKYKIYECLYLEGYKFYW